MLFSNIIENLALLVSIDCWVNMIPADSHAMTIHTASAGIIQPHCSRPAGTTEHGHTISALYTLDCVTVGVYVHPDPQGPGSSSVLGLSSSTT